MPGNRVGGTWHIGQNRPWFSSLIKFEDRQMTESEFQAQLTILNGLTFQEDFEAALCELYLAAKPTQRDTLRAAQNSGDLQLSKPWRNPTDYDRTELSREKYLRQSLIKLSIADGTGDYRDDLLSIAFCYHNLLLIGVDAETFLKQIADISGPAFGKWILSFINRSSESKSLQQWGLKIVSTSSGLIASFH